MNAARPELLSLIRHAKDDPDDASRRLVLADWLEEHGDDADRARGEFLRLRVEAATATRPRPLRERARAKWLTWREAWAAGLGASPESLSPTEDGLLRWECPATALTQRAAAALAATEAFAWVAALRPVRLQARSFMRVVRSGLLGGVVSLDLHELSVRGDGAAALAHLPADGPLREIDLRRAHLEHAGLKRLLTAGFLPRLRHLNLERNALTGDDLDGLADAPLTSLRSLDLGQNEVGRGTERLARAGWLAGLERLGLAVVWPDRWGLRAFLARADLSALRHLDLSQNDHRDAEFVHGLAESRSLSRLERLTLTTCSLDDDALARLAALPLFSRLAAVELGGNRLTDAGVHHLAAAPMSERFVELDLSFNPIGADGLRTLAGWPALASVRRLALAGLWMAEADADVLLGSPYTRSLRRLTVLAGPPPDALQRLRERFVVEATL